MKQGMPKVLVVLTAVLALAALAGCGSDNKVGNKSLLDFKEQANSRLGETTTTMAAATTTTKAAVTTTTKPGTKPSGSATTTTKPAGGAGTPTPTTTAPKATQTIREIDILADSPFFDPATQTAYVGSVIRWINKDTVPRSVKADSGQFASPMIPPGGSYDYVAGTVGIFAYADDTRPYVKGELQVAKP